MCVCKENSNEERGDSSAESERERKRKTDDVFLLLPVFVKILALAMCHSVAIVNIVFLL